MSEIEFFVKLRDASAIILDACNEMLEAKAPVKEFGPEDFDKLDWSQQNGAKGPYLQTTKEANKDNLAVFSSLRQQLLEHDGFWQTPEHLYWFHRNDQDTIDRRAKA